MTEIGSTEARSSKQRRLTPAYRPLLLGLTVPFALFTVACSGTSHSNQNTISPYDREFDPEGTSDDNAETTTTLSEEELVSKATAAYDRGLYTLSREHWTQLREQHPGSYFATLAELKVADSYFFAGEYTAAITAYEEFVKLHPAHEAGAYARYQVGNAHREQYSGIPHDPSPLREAIKHYRTLIAEYPASEFAAAARRSIDQSRVELSNYELAVARYYISQGQLDAARERLFGLRTNYPDTPPVMEGTVGELLASLGGASAEPAESGGWAKLLDSGERTAQVVEAFANAKPSGPQLPTPPELLISRSSLKRDAGITNNAQTTLASRAPLVGDGSPSGTALPSRPGAPDIVRVIDERGTAGPRPPALVAAGRRQSSDPGAITSERAAMGAASVSPRIFGLSCEVAPNGIMLFTARTSAVLKTDQASVREGGTHLFRLVPAERVPAGPGSPADATAAPEQCTVPGAALTMTPAQGAIDGALTLERRGRIRLMHLDRPARTIFAILPEE